MMQLISLFENVTHSRVKDAFDDAVQGKLIFVVQPGELMKAVGKQASNIKRLEQKFGKKVKVFEFNPELERFIRNAIYPLKVQSVEKDLDDENIIILKSDDVKVKGLLIGRNASNLRNLEEIVKRYFPDLVEIKVI